MRQTYKAHERSREAIELAYDSILQEKMKVRHKFGFQPPQRGRRRDLQADPLVSSLPDIPTLQHASLWNTDAGPVLLIGLALYWQLCTVSHCRSWPLQAVPLDQSLCALQSAHSLQHMHASA